ncbi:MAG: AMP-dependent synthetase/ligase [Bacteroidales bacterium]
MQTIISLFEESVRKFGNNPLMLEKKKDKFQSTTYNEIHKTVFEFAAGLMSMGVVKGDRIALLSEGRNDWVISELAVLYAGAVNIPLSVKLGDASEIKFRLAHSGSKIIIISGGQAHKMKELKHELPELEKVVLLDKTGDMDSMDILYEEVRAMGKEFLKKEPDVFMERWSTIEADDYANICYTSGTTADPKGIILSHRNYTANVEQARSLMDVPEWYTTLLILPWDHAFAHTAGIYTLIASGASMASVQSGKTPMETLKNIPQNIKEVKPVFLLSVPALAKNFRKNIEAGVRQKGKLAKSLFGAALRTAYAYNGTGWNRGSGFRILLKPLVSIFDAILFKKVRENFGGRLRFFIGGGALLDIELQRFFYALGIPMFQGYGLSEASPIISSNSEARHKLGSSGYLVSDIELKICNENKKELPTGEKGEIVVRGENVMKGYWKNQEATESTIIDGWLYTGDMGYMDKDGFLYVLGRFKSLLISDDGEKYSPEGIEEAFTGQSQYIDQCMLYNNQKPYTVALIVPNKEALKRWLAEKNLQPETREGQEALLKLIELELNEYRIGRKYEKMFPQRWLPASIGILDEGFTESNHLLNSTLKMVRGKITEKYKDRINYLYKTESKDICNTENIEAIRKLMEPG